MTSKRQKPCIRCGRMHNTHFKLCRECYHYEQNRLLDEIESNIMVWPDDIEQPESMWCVMCGREWGTNLRSDGKYYCATCWAIWNS